MKVLQEYWASTRIEIYSEPIRFIPTHSEICIRANLNSSESNQDF